ncbi:MAG: DUF4249 family protein [Bacteroidetes bacterium]|nr:DUF4249 family protein [Bacteroidota bacterium]
MSQSEGEKKYIGAEHLRKRNNDIMKRFYRFIFISLVAFSCEKPIDWDLQTEDLNSIVVEAIITSEFKTQEIKLSYTITDMNANPLPVTGAKVSVSFQPYSISFEESESYPGVYYSTEQFRGATDVEYTLKIELDTIEYTATTNMVNLQIYNTPPFVYFPEVNAYRLLWDFYQYSPVEQSFTDVIVVWNHIPGYEHPDSLSSARLQFYKFKTIDVSYIVAPQDREKVFFPQGSIAYCSKYSLNDEFGAYLRAVLIESQWQGSLFEASRANPLGNISGGALGFFAVCDVMRDTLEVGQ